MSKNYQQLFSQLEVLPEPQGLLEKIITKISRKQLLKARTRVITFSLVFIVSVIAFLPAFNFLKSGMIESGFDKFVSLIFTDSNFVISYWQNFLLTLLEALPIMGLVSFLGVTWLILESSKLLFKDLKTNFKFNY